MRSRAARWVVFTTSLILLTPHGATTFAQTPPPPPCIYLPCPDPSPQCFWSNAGCGDGYCSADERVMGCLLDCSPCGDGVCSTPELLDTCFFDCDQCGDNDDTCESPLNATDCPGDCGCTPTDSCDSCGPAAPGADEDIDGIPDLLEQEIAYRFFPNIQLQYAVPDRNQFYPFIGRAIPYTVQPYVQPGTVCANPDTCLEVRWGIAYTNDCGDYLPGESRGRCDPTPGPFNSNSGHPGDSELYAALVMRYDTAESALADPNKWFLLRDFTAAHWGGDGDSSVQGKYGLCSTCSELTQAQCDTDPDCFYYLGLCMEISNGQTCYSSEGRLNPPRLYASVGKHALYHTKSECDGGGKLGADSCEDGVYDAHCYIANLLQNAGDLEQRHYIDGTISAPDCSTYSLDGTATFGDAADYRTHLLTDLNWDLPDDHCQIVETTGVSYFTAPGCGGMEYWDHQEGTSRHSWDGWGCAGQTRRPAVVYSYKDSSGTCVDQWPSGEERFELSPIDRGCPCPEPYCRDAELVDASYYSSSDCSSLEYFYIGDLDMTRGSWDGVGCVGYTGHSMSSLSVRTSDGYCRNMSVPQDFDGMARVFRDAPLPTGGCPACGETYCSPVDTASGSYFTASECSGDEYATPTGSTHRQSWEGSGCSGNLFRNVTFQTMRDSQGYCWPAPGSASSMVKVYRQSQPALPACNPCSERSCTAVSSTSFSYFTDSDCAGDEYVDVVSGQAARFSWDGHGCAGDLVHGATFIRSYKDPQGKCHDNFPDQFLGGMLKIYRDTGEPPPCRGCPNVKDGNGP